MKKLNELDQLHEKADIGFRDLIGTNKIATLPEKHKYITELTRHINNIKERIPTPNTYKNLEDYLNSNEESCLELKNFLNENKNLAAAAAGTYSSIFDRSRFAS